jgi:hypothetical protein
VIAPVASVRWQVLVPANGLVSAMPLSSIVPEPEFFIVMV